jgi:Domain of unknown function (DUF4386)
MRTAGQPADQSTSPPVVRPDSRAHPGMPYRRTAVIVGSLFILQMILFAIGSSLVEQYLRGDAERPTLTTGVCLELLAGVAVVAIGLLMYPVLRVVNATWALAYPILRLIEFGVSAVLAGYLLAQLEEFPNHLLWVYLPTALGGLVLNYLFLVSGLVPRPIAVLGLVGYALLLLTVPLGLLGVVDVESGAGLMMLAPGGVYEFLILPIWLIAKGFRVPYSARRLPARSSQGLPIGSRAVPR